VASFIGLPPMNFFNVTVREGELEGHGFRVKLTEEEKGMLLPYAGKEIDLGVRPEDVIGGGEIAMNVFSNENLGMNTLVHGHIGHSDAVGNKISAKLRGWYDYKEGDSVDIAFSRKHFFDKESGESIERRNKA
jgi:multiple sugar transport system ATP-binding protein